MGGGVPLGDTEGVRVWEGVGGALGEEERVGRLNTHDSVALGDAVRVNV